MNLPTTPLSSGNFLSKLDSELKACGHTHTNYPFSFLFSRGDLMVLFWVATSFDIQLLSVLYGLPSLSSLVTRNY